MSSRPVEHKSLFQPSRIARSGRSIDDLPLPEDAIGYPELVFEDLLDEEVIEDLIQRARKPVNGNS